MAITQKIGFRLLYIDAKRVDKRKWARKITLMTQNMSVDLFIKFYVVSILRACFWKIMAPIIISAIFAAMFRQKHKKLRIESQFWFFLSSTFTSLRLKWARDADSGAC